MKQGTARHAHADRGNDLYETPDQATLALLRVERLPRRLWEPAAGRGAMARHLLAAGHDMVMTDLCAYDRALPGIVAPVDFLATAAAPTGVEAIVTNPPYKIADPFIRHALALVPLVVVLLRLASLEGAKRADLIDTRLRRVWVGKERLPMMHRDGWEGAKIGNSGAPFAWFVFTAEPRGEAPIEVRRMSWRDAPPRGLSRAESVPDIGTDEIEAAMSEMF